MEKTDYQKAMEILNANYPTFIKGDYAEICEKVGFENNLDPEEVGDACFDYFLEDILISSYDGDITIN